MYVLPVATSSDLGLDVIYVGLFLIFEKIQESFCDEHIIQCMDTAMSLAVAVQPWTRGHTVCVLYFRSFNVSEVRYTGRTSFLSFIDYSCVQHISYSSFVFIQSVIERFHSLKYIKCSPSPLLPLWEKRWHFFQNDIKYNSIALCCVTSYFVSMLSTLYCLLWVVQ